MTRRGETRAVILAYLRDERALGPMCRYLFERHGINGGAVREQLARMVRAGDVERIGRGRYRRKQPRSAGVTGASHDSDTLGHNLTR